MKTRSEAHTPHFVGCTRGAGPADAAVVKLDFLRCAEILACYKAFLQLGRRFRAHELWLDAYGHDVTWTRGGWGDDEELARTHPDVRAWANAMAPDLDAGPDALGFVYHREPWVDPLPDLGNSPPQRMRVDAKGAAWEYTDPAGRVDVTAVLPPAIVVALARRLNPGHDLPDFCMHCGEVRDAARTYARIKRLALARGAFDEQDACVSCGQVPERRLVDTLGRTFWSDGVRPRARS